MLDPEKALREHLIQDVEGHLDRTSVRRLQKFLYSVNTFIRRFRFLREDKELLDQYVLCWLIL